MKGELEMVLTVPDDATASGYGRLRVYGTRERPLWVASDLAAVLNIKNIRQNMANLEADDKGVWSVYTRGGSQQMAVVNEFGLYKLIFASRTQEAKLFQRWVVSKVLPAIRQYGCYPPPAVKPVEKAPAGCDWADVVRTLADGQREIAVEVVKMGRQIESLAERVEVIGTGVAHLMLNQRPQPEAVQEKRELFQSKKSVAAAIRAELVKNPHRSDEVILDEIRTNYGVSANRTTVYRHRTEMESTREIEPAPVRVGRDGRKSKVKYDAAKLPFHTSVDDLNDATP